MPTRFTVDDSYTVSYYKADDDFNKVGDAISAIVEPGKYLVAVSDGKGGEAVAKVNVKGATLTGITYYEADADDPYAVSDQDLIFTGKALDVRFQVSGSTSSRARTTPSRSSRRAPTRSPTPPVDDVLEAGDYVGYVTGIGQYAGETDEVEFTVNAFTFSASNVTVDDVIGSNTKPAHPTKVTNGETGSKYAELDPSLVDLVFVKGTGGEAGAENNNTPAPSSSTRPVPTSSAPSPTRTRSRRRTSPTARPPATPSTSTRSPRQPRSSTTARPSRTPT